MTTSPTPSASVRPHPQRLQELQDENQRRQRELEGLEQQLEQHDAEVVEVKRKESECQIELEHFQKQKGSVTNEREFTAVISEIDYATKALQENSDRRHELEAEMQHLRDEIATRRDSREDEEATQCQVVKSWESRKGKLKKLVHDYAKQAKELEAQLEPKNRARFVRLVGKKGRVSDGRRSRGLMLAVPLFTSAASPAASPSRPGNHRLRALPPRALPDRHGGRGFMTCQAAGGGLLDPVIVLPRT